jgi:hypothetical protein
MYPLRDKASDGAVGDLRHRASKSDHNPNPAGVVTAIDIDKDLSASDSVGLIVERLYVSRDPRIKYVIWQGRICSSKVQPWIWRKYTGANGHFQHVHISVDDDKSLYDDESDWSIGQTAETQPDTSQDVGTYTVQAGDSLWKIASTFKTSVYVLKELNGLRSDVIQPGQKLRLK